MASSKITEIAERLAKLSPEAQEEELQKIERNVTRRESKAQKDALSQHKEALGEVFVNALQLYAREKKVDVSTLLPLTIKVAQVEDGSIAGTVSGRGGRGGGAGGGTRGESFLKANNIVAIELEGKPLDKCAESEVLRVAHGAKTGKEIYQSASPHQVAMKPENQKLIKDKGFVAVTKDDERRPLHEFYASAS